MNFPTFTDFELMLLEEVHQHQLHSNPQTELIIMVTSDGQDVIDKTVGTRRGAYLTKTMLDALSAGQSARIIHNHPDNGSISLDDWQVSLAYPGITDIVAVNTNRSIFRASVNDRDCLRKIINKYADALESIEQETCRPVPTGSADSATVAVLPWTVSDILNFRLSQIGAINYEVHYGVQDLVILNLPFAVSRLLDGKSVANRIL